LHEKRTRTFRVCQLLGVPAEAFAEARRNFREFGASERRFVENVRTSTSEEQA